MWLIQMPSGWHHGGLFMGSMHWLWWIFWALVLAVIGWALWRLVREARSRDVEEKRRETAEESLRRRYGEGEIEEDEFLHRMRVLRESRSPEGGDAREA